MVQRWCFSCLSTRMTESGRRAGTGPLLAEGDRGPSAHVSGSSQPGPITGPTAVGPAQAWQARRDCLVCLDCLDCLVSPQLVIRPGLTGPSGPCPWLR